MLVYIYARAHHPHTPSHGYEDENASTTRSFASTVRRLHHSHAPLNRCEGASSTPCTLHRCEGDGTSTLIRFRHALLRITTRRSFESMRGHIINARPLHINCGQGRIDHKPFFASTVRCSQQPRARVHLREGASTTKPSSHRCDGDGASTTCSCTSTVCGLYHPHAPSHLPSFVSDTPSFTSQQNTSVDRRSVVSINHTRLVHIDPRALHRRPAFRIDPRAHQPHEAPSHRCEV